MAHSYNSHPHWTGSSSSTQMGLSQHGTSSGPTTSRQSALVERMANGHHRHVDLEFTQRWGRGGNRKSPFSLQRLFLHRKELNSLPWVPLSPNIQRIHRGRYQRSLTKNWSCILGVGRTLLSPLGELFHMEQWIGWFKWLEGEERLKPLLHQATRVTRATLFYHKRTNEV